MTDVDKKRTDAVRVGRRPAMSSPRALLRACRPRQWTKNLLVLVAPAASGVITQPRGLLAAVVAVLAFGLASAGIYLVNDVVDVEADRRHPSKRRRPVAAGELSTRAAVLNGVVLLAAALTVAAAQSWQLLVVIAVYEAIQLGYCLGWKNQPVIELMCVASGFLLRAIAGGVAVHVDLSQWFLTAAGFGALFVAAGKRYAESVRFAKTGAAVRPVLAAYTDTYLRFVWTMSAAVLVLTYALWAFTIRESTGTVWSVVSTVPFLAAVLRYAVDVDGGQAGEPEEILFRDRFLLGSAAVWAVTMVAAVYL